MLSSMRNRSRFTLNRWRARNESNSGRERLIGRLETLVNGAIEKFTPERVVDIKYSSAIDGRYHEHYYSAMVILKDEEDKKDGNETSM